jgi:sulfur-oxidizing protein SoxY
MNRLRRTLVGALAVVLAKPIAVLAAWNEAAFAAKTPQDALKGIGAPDPLPSKDILIEAPQIAENGAVVPIEITSNIPGTTSVAVVLEKNPFPLAAKFDFKEGALPYVKVNVKMAETANVRVVAAAGGKHHFATREVKVTIGGCGG